MTNVREAKLRGIRAATEAHNHLGLDKHIREGRHPIDIFGAISDLEIPIVCRPLDGLLGAYYNNGLSHGILVTTNRKLNVQRFTAAHELGHYWLEHATSLDNEDSLKKLRSGHQSLGSIQEIEAEAFASEFLLPKSLLVSTAKVLGWSRSDLKQPEHAYQLSLRTGTSYEATWRALIEHGLIDRSAADILKSTPPKESKISALRGKSPSNPWADALRLEQRDSGTHLIASPEDTIAIELDEHSGSGYRWVGLEDQKEIKLLEDFTEGISSEPAIGSMTRRILRFQCGGGQQQIRLSERRPWETDGDPLNSFNIAIDFCGKEAGLPRAARK